MHVGNMHAGNMHACFCGALTHVGTEGPAAAHVTDRGCQKLLYPGVQTGNAKILSVKVCETGGWGS